MYYFVVYLRCIHLDTFFFFVMLALDDGHTYAYSTTLAANRFGFDVASALFIPVIIHRPPPCFSVAITMKKRVSRPCAT